jgi:hypothetical protein
MRHSYRTFLTKGTFSLCILTGTESLCSYTRKPMS